MSNTVVFDETNTTHKTWKGAGRLIAIGLILAVAALGDVMYIQLVGSRFPSGFLLLFCYVGAFASFFAFAYLLIGKLVIFRPGPQMFAAWGLFALEILIASLNMMLVFQGVNNATGFMGLWLTISPATPFIVMAVVALVFFLDPELKQRHDDMELQAQLNAMERQFVKMQAVAEMEVKKETLKLTQALLIEQIQEGHNVETLRKAAGHMYADIMSALTGRSIPALNSGKTVDSTVQPVPVSLAQTADVAETPIKEGKSTKSKK